MKEQKKYLDLLFRAPALFCELSPDGTTVFVNPAVTDILGYSTEEVIGANWWELVYPGKHNSDAADLIIKIEMGHVVFHETVFVGKDGEKRPLCWSSINTYGENGEITGIIGLGIDRTAQKKAEEERDRLDKKAYSSIRTESLGLLAGGIVHEFNNLLAVIISYADLLVEELQCCEDLSQDAQEVGDAGRRAAELTEQLLLFSRREAVKPGIVDMNRVVLGLLKLLGKAVGEHMEISVDLSEEPARMFTDPGKMELMLIDLVILMKEAIPEGGSLVIETKNMEIDEEEARKLIGLRPGRYVRLELKGAPLDKAEIRRIFNQDQPPEIAASVYSVIQQALGVVSKESMVSGVFAVFFPAARDIQSERRASSSYCTAVGTGKTILVVETEGALRTLISKVLTREGYEVLQARSGEEGLVVGENHEGVIDLLLTDVIMPGVTGTTLAQKLTSDRPKMKVLYITGYTDEMLARHGIEEIGSLLVRKPFTGRALIKKLDELLGYPASNK